MTFTVDYDKHYKSDKKACGNPFPEIISCLEQSFQPGMTALDLGCGQGRDSLPMATMGYSVTAVDVSKVGLKQLTSLAEKKNPDIKTIHADAFDFKTRKKFDAIVIDRVLHILPNTEEREVVHTLRTSRDT